VPPLKLLLLLLLLPLLLILLRGRFDSAQGAAAAAIIAIIDIRIIIVPGQIVEEREVVPKVLVKAKPEATIGAGHDRGAV